MTMMGRHLVLLRAFDLNCIVTGTLKVGGNIRYGMKHLSISDLVRAGRNLRRKFVVSGI